MSLQEAVENWKTSANEDWKLATDLLKSKKYSYSLFFAQMALEKLIKAIHIKRFDTHPLFVHNLVLLAQKAELELTTEEFDDLKEISSFNISARYDSYKREFYQKATPEYTQIWFSKAAKLRDKLICNL